MSKVSKIRTRQAISLEVKLKILDCLARGEGATHVGKKFGLNEATIRTIKKNEKAIRKSVICSSKLSSTRSSYIRDKVLVKMEKCVVLWIEDLLQKRIPIDGSMMKKKALQVYNQLQTSEPSTSSQEKRKEFRASEGWLTGFLKRNAFHNLKLKGEGALGDKEAAESFPAKLATIIEVGGYVPDQIFNADESILFWKKLPTRAFEREPAKVPKDRVTVLLCSNASGDKILKPLLINRSLRPLALRGKNIQQLPVHWKANKKACLTAGLFTEWFEECFVPEVKRYMEQRCLQFKVLLIIDNVPSHPVLEHPNVQVIFLPPNTTSIIQPLDQGIIATFKLCYIQQVFLHILEVLEKDHLTFIDAWNKYSIMDCITYASLAKEMLRVSTLNAGWKALLPECVKSDNSVPTQTMVESSKIIALAHKIGGEGFDDLQLEDISELIIDKPLDVDELIDLVAEEGNAEDSNSNKEEENAVVHNIKKEEENAVVHNIKKEEETATCQLTAGLIGEGLKLGKCMVNHFLKIDPNMERARKFERDMKNCLAEYQKLHKELKKPKVQLSVTDFLMLEWSNGSV